MEGFLFGIAALAFSQVDKGWAELEAAAAAARQLVLDLHARQCMGAAPWLLNVNIPNMPLPALKPLAVCRLGRRHAAQGVITQQSPGGETMYWIGGSGAAKDDGPGTDFYATACGHVALTPLMVDLTDHAHLAHWAQALAAQGLT